MSLFVEQMGNLAKVGRVLLARTLPCEEVPDLLALEPGILGAVRLDNVPVGVAGNHVASQKVRLTIVS